MFLEIKVTAGSAANILYIIYTKGPPETYNFFSTNQPQPSIKSGLTHINFIFNKHKEVPLKNYYLERSETLKRPLSINSSETRVLKDLSQPITSSEARGLRDLCQPIT